MANDNLRDWIAGNVKRILAKDVSEDEKAELLTDYVLEATGNQAFKPKKPHSVNTNRREPNKRGHLISLAF